MDFSLVKNLHWFVRLLCKLSQKYKREDAFEMLEIPNTKNYPDRAEEIKETPFMNVHKQSRISEEGIVKYTKQRPPTWTENLRYYFAQYCGLSTIHGVQYIGERGRFIIEKITWGIILLGVWYLCILLIVKAHHKWITSNVIVTFATTETAISEIPFPAITICPQVKTDSEIFNYTDVLIRKIEKANLTDDEDRQFEAISLLCSAQVRLLLGYFAYGNRTIPTNVINDLVETHPQDSYGVNFTWMGHKYPSDELLSQTVSSTGLCYSFNMLRYSEILKYSQEYTNLRSVNNTKARYWSLKNGYSDGNEEDTFPRRTFISGMNGGFQATLISNHTHLDHLCTGSLQGFQVTLHHPSELPNMDKHFHVPLDQSVFIAVKPRVITASELLRSYKVSDRKCYLPDERNLKFYKYYTQQNCLDECLSNYTLSICGCVAFYMPKLGTSPICGPGSQKCLDKSKVNYLSKQNDDCSCFPSCVSIEYDMEISQTDWNWRGLFQTLNRISDNFYKTFHDHDMVHFTQIAVYYKDMQFMTSERNELYGFVEFFANIGGIMGLFVGFSVTSLIEIIYFVTLRLACNIRRFGQAYWSGEPDLIKSRIVD